MDISKNAQVYIFYSDFHHKQRNMVEVSIEGSIMTIPIDNILDLYEKIVENQFMWQTKRKHQGKQTTFTTQIPFSFGSQVELITRKLDNSMSMVHQPAPVCKSCEADHIPATYHLATCIFISLNRYNMNKIFRGNRITLTPTPIIQVGEIIQTSHGLVIGVKKIRFRKIHQDFSNNKRRRYLWKNQWLSVLSRVRLILEPANCNKKFENSNGADGSCIVQQNTRNLAK